MHNHALDVKLHRHPMACRLSREERNVISDLTVVKVAPRNILVDLKRNKPDSVSNIKQVYNERHNLKVLNMGTRRTRLIRWGLHFWSVKKKTTLRGPWEFASLC